MDSKKTRIKAQQCGLFDSTYCVGVFNGQFSEFAIFNLDLYAFLFSSPFNCRFSCLNETTFFLWKSLFYYISPFIDMWLINARDTLENMFFELKFSFEVNSNKFHRISLYHANKIENSSQWLDNERLVDATRNVHLFYSCFQLAFHF